MLPFTHSAVDICEAVVRAGTVPEGQFPERILPSVVLGVALGESSCSAHMLCLAFGNPCSKIGMPNKVGFQNTSAPLGKAVFTRTKIDLASYQQPFNAYFKY